MVIWFLPFKESRRQSDDVVYMCALRPSDVWIGQSTQPAKVVTAAL